MDESKKILRAEREFSVRFSEVDSMGIVWHGSYPLYFEDAREEFGRLYHLEYMHMFEMGFYAPLVDMQFHFKKPLKYGDSGKVVITMRNTDAAKILFDYEIYNKETGELAATGSSTQVFLDKDYNLVWTMPEFFIEWKRMNGLEG